MLGHDYTAVQKLLLTTLGIVLLVGSSQAISCHKCIVETFSSPNTPPNYYTIDADPWSDTTTHCLENTVDCGGRCVSLTVADDGFGNGAEAVTYYFCVEGDEDPCEAVGYESGSADCSNPVLCDTPDLCNSPPLPQCPTCSQQFGGYCSGSAPCSAAQCGGVTASCFTRFNPGACTVERGCLEGEDVCEGDLCERSLPTEPDAVSSAICAKECVTTSCPVCSFTVTGDLNSTSPELAECEELTVCAQGVAGCRVGITDACLAELACGGDVVVASVDTVVDAVQAEIEKRDLECGADATKAGVITITLTLLVFLISWFD